MATFSALGLSSTITDVLADEGITAPFPIQNATIPDALAGRDVAGRAPTGSGKTLAFGLPILSLVPKAKPNRPTALILAPTRELAAQIRLDLAPYGKAMGRQVFAVFGGIRYSTQQSWLGRGVDVLVATPGRLEDLIEQGLVDLKAVGVVAIDEADRMADMGFLPAVKRILDQTSDDRQTLLYSATLDGDVAVLVNRYQRDPVRHEVGSKDADATDATHHFWVVEHKDKIKHTAETINASGSTIVFVRTRHGTDRLARQLKSQGVDAAAMHGGLTQNQRNKALRSFDKGTVQALVATDVAARGIHVDDVQTVIHYDIPHGHKDYVHRSGRTARAGASGIVLSLLTKSEKRAAGRMQRNLGMDVPMTSPRPDAVGGVGAPVRTTARTGAKSAKVDSEPNRRKGESRNAKKRRPPQTHNVESKGGAPQLVYVGNLPWSMTDDDLAVLASEFGPVAKANVKMDKRGRSKGVGFVTMARGDASRAVHGLNGRPFGGRPLKARFAEQRDPNRR